MYVAVKGGEKAIAAARAVGGQAVLPPFRPTDQGSDWNDFATRIGFPEETVPQ